MPKLNDYLQGMHERPPQPKFLTAMTEKVDILATLTQEMRALVDQATVMYESLVQSLPLNTAVIASDGSEANTAETAIQDDAYIIAGTLNAMERELELFVS